MFQMPNEFLAVTPKRDFPLRLLRWFHLIDISRPKDENGNIAQKSKYISEK